VGLLFPQSPRFAEISIWSSGYVRAVFWYQLIWGVPMVVGMRLSAAQRRVLEGAAAGELRAYRSFGGRVSFWLMSMTHPRDARTATVEALQSRGLLEVVEIPFRQTVAIRPTEAGRREVS
jgi:hypothetical protein